MQTFQSIILKDSELTGEVLKSAYYTYKWDEREEELGKQLLASNIKSFFPSHEKQIENEIQMEGKRKVQLAVNDICL